MSGKSKSGRSLNEELGDEDSERKRKAAFFSWSRTRSTGRSQKKKDHGDRPNGSWCVLCGGAGARRSQHGLCCELARGAASRGRLRRSKVGPSGLRLGFSVPLDFCAGGVSASL